MDFRDRRPKDHLPQDSDYSTPLTRTNLAEANRRFRQTGVSAPVGNSPTEAARLIAQATKARFNARRKGQEDFATIGEYLAYLNGESE